MHRRIYARHVLLGGATDTWGSSHWLSPGSKKSFSYNYMYNNQFTVDLTVKEESRIPDRHYRETLECRMSFLIYGKEVSYKGRDG